MRGNKRKAPRSSKSCPKKRIGAKGSREKESASDCQQDLAPVQQMVPLLPNEVSDQIASYLNTRPDHSAMSLVCRNFTASAQRALFTNVFLDSTLDMMPWQLVSFARSVITRPHLAHHVSKLVMSIEPLDGRNPEGESRHYMRNPYVHVAGADCRLLRKAAKEAHISYPFRHESDDARYVFAPVARFCHAVYAIILSRVPNLRSLSMQLAITGNYDSQILSESVDELVKHVSSGSRAIRQFAHLEELEVGTVDASLYQGAHAFRTPSFMADLLKNSAIRRFTTNDARLLPDLSLYISGSSVVSLDARTTKHWGWRCLGFFTACCQLQQVECLIPNLMAAEALSGLANSMLNHLTLLSPSDSNELPVYLVWQNGGRWRIPGLWQTMQLNKMTSLKTLHVHWKLVASSAQDLPYQWSLVRMLPKSLEKLVILQLKTSEICAKSSTNLTRFRWLRFQWTIKYLDLAYWSGNEIHHLKAVQFQIWADESVDLSSKKLIQDWLRKCTENLRALPLTWDIVSDHATLAAEVKALST